MFDGFETASPTPVHGQDVYGLGACLAATSFGAGDVAAVVTCLMQVTVVVVVVVVLLLLLLLLLLLTCHHADTFSQRNPKLSCVFASRAPLTDVPGVLLKMQPLHPDVQGQLFAEIAMPPDMAARRPQLAIDWKETCARMSGCSPLCPLIQGFMRGSTTLQVLQQLAAALAWLKFLTSQSLNLAPQFVSHDPPGLRIHSVVITTPLLHASDNLLSIKLQINGSRYTSVPQTIALTPGACEHSCRVAVDDALGGCVSVGVRGVWQWWLWWWQ